MCKFDTQTNVWYNLNVNIRYLREGEPWHTM